MRHLEEPAAYLASCRTSGALIGRLPGVAELTQDEAYVLQALVHRRLQASPRHGAVAGHKIGCTTSVMQKFLQIDRPCAGGVFAATVLHEDGEFPASRFGRLGAECEIAVTLKHTLGVDAAPYDRESVASAVSSCHAAIEIVEDRYRDFAALGAPTLTGDDFFGAGCVLGKPVRDWRSLDLAATAGRMWVNAQSRGEGLGADIMGHPLEALAWLANQRVRLGRPLTGGCFVLLGSLVQTVWLEAHDRVEIEVAGLGRARLTVGEPRR